MKRFLLVVLALLMVFATLGSASPASDFAPRDAQDGKLQALSCLGVCAFSAEYNSDRSTLCRWENENCISEMTDHVTDYWKWMGIDIPRIRPMDPDVHNVPKLCVHCSPEQEAAFVTPLLKHSWTARITPDLVDLIPNGVGKDTGIREVCERFGISREETMGFGDGQNDLVMLKYVGTAVAMDNAADNVKAAADYVTLTTEEGGITKALQHFGLL